MHITKTRFCKIQIPAFPPHPYSDVYRSERGAETCVFTSIPGETLCRWSAGHFCKTLIGGSRNTDGEGADSSPNYLLGCRGRSADCTATKSQEAEGPKGVARNPDSLRPESHRSNPGSRIFNRLLAREGHSWTFSVLVNYFMILGAE